MNPNHNLNPLPVKLRGGRLVRLVLLLVLLAGLAPGQAGAAGYWTQLVNPVPSRYGVNLMLLLPDGTVMAAENNGFLPPGVNWFRLTPGSQGGYTNGTWSGMNPMTYNRMFYASQVLTNGNVLVAGGEYGAGNTNAELYNTLSQQWSVVDPPDSLLDPSQDEGFEDSESMMLPDGTVLLHPVDPAINNETLIYNPAANTWALGPATVQLQDEATWVKLPDGSLISIDPINTGTNGVSDNGYGMTIMKNMTLLLIRVVCFIFLVCMASIWE